MVKPLESKVLNGEFIESTQEFILPAPADIPPTEVEEGSSHGDCFSRKPRILYGR
jgi:hypothetical protein